MTLLFLAACAPVESELAADYDQPISATVTEPGPSKGAFDLNGDGYSDLVVGAPNVDGGAGRVYVWYGSAAGVDFAAWDVINTGSERGVGLWLRGAGDVDGDGNDELMFRSEDGSILLRTPSTNRTLLGRGTHSAYLARGKSGLLLLSHGSDGSVVVSKMAEDWEPPLATIPNVLSATRSFPLVADFDGDNLSDLVFADGATLNVVRGPLDGEEPILLQIPLPLAALAGESMVEFPSAFGSGLAVLTGEHIVLVQDPLGGANARIVELQQPSVGPLLAADLDGLGEIELAVAGSADGSVEILSLPGGESVGALPSAAADRAGDGSGDRLAAFDADGDGLPELLHSRPRSLSGGSIDVWRWSDVAAGVPMMEIHAPESADAFVSPAIVGLGDGTVVVSNDAQLMWMDGAGTGGFFSVSGADHTGAGPTPVGDVTGDGLADLLLGDAYGSRLHIFAGNGAGFGENPAFSLPTGGGQIVSAVGDIQGDGYDDFATWVTTGDGEHRQLELWGGGGVPTVLARLEIPGSNVGSLAGGDLDDDGYAEVAASDGRSVFVWAGGPAGINPEPILRYVDVGTALVLPGDFDGDGRADIVSAGVESAETFRVCTTRVPYNEAFRCASVASFGANDVVLANLGDFDQDGWPDVAIGPATCSADSRVSILWGGDWRILPYELVVSDAAGLCAPSALGDVDGDGYPDLAVQSVGMEAGKLTTVWRVGGAAPGAVPVVEKILPVGHLNAGFGAAMR